MTLPDYLCHSPWLSQCSVLRPPLSIPVPCFPTLQMFIAVFLFSFFFVNLSSTLYTLFTCILLYCYLPSKDSLFLHPPPESCPQVPFLTSRARFQSQFIFNRPQKKTTKKAQNPASIIKQRLRRFHPADGAQICGV